MIKKITRWGQNMDSQEKKPEKKEKKREGEEEEKEVFFEKMSDESQGNTSACFQKLQILNENARSNFLIKEDYRNERVDVAHFSDDLLLRDYLRVNFEAIDSQHGIFRMDGKKNGNKKYLKSCTELNEELRRRKIEFGRLFKNGMVSGNKVKVSTNTIPVIKFKSNVAIVAEDSDDEDEDGDFVPEIAEIVNKNHDKPENTDNVVLDNSCEFTHKINSDGGILLIIGFESGYFKHPILLL